MPIPAMKFCIITPTYKRQNTLRRAIESVLQQSHQDLEMIIINDNPNDGTALVVSDYSDPRLIFLENESNRGVNASRNRGLDTISKDTEYVIFLDDDDFLAPNALADLATILEKTPYPWLLTARGSTEENPTTQTIHNGVFSYAHDYLLTRKIKGDATHCINANLIREHSLRFPTRITQAEEWLFYFCLGRFTQMYYIAKVTTLTDGYSASGLNLRKRTTREQLHTLTLIFTEARSRKITFDPNFWIYFVLRTLRAFIKRK